VTGKIPDLQMATKSPVQRMLNAILMIFINQCVWNSLNWCHKQAYTRVHVFSSSTPRCVLSKVMYNYCSEWSTLLRVESNRLQQHSKVHMYSQNNDSFLFKPLYRQVLLVNKLWTFKIVILNLFVHIFVDIYN